MLRGELAPLGLGNDPSLGDADQGIVRLEILAPAVERLIGGDEREPLGIGEIEQRRFDLLFFGHAVPLQLDIESVAEQRREAPATRRREVSLAGYECQIERTAGPATQDDQP